MIRSSIPQELSYTVRGQPKQKKLPLLTEYSPKKRDMKGHQDKKRVVVGKLGETEQARRRRHPMLLRCQRLRLNALYGSPSVVSLSERRRVSQSASKGLSQTTPGGVSRIEFPSESISQTASKSDSDNVSENVSMSVSQRTVGSVSLSRPVSRQLDGARKPAADSSTNSTRPPQTMPDYALVDLDDAVLVHTLQLSRVKIPSPQDDHSYQVPSTVNSYEVDTEHAYIMAKALKSYREHCARERWSLKRAQSDVHGPRQDQDQIGLAHDGGIAIPGVEPGKGTLQNAIVFTPVTRRPVSAEPRLLSQHHQLHHHHISIPRGEDAQSPRSASSLRRHRPSSSPATTVFSSLQALREVGRVNNYFLERSATRPVLRTSTISLSMEKASQAMNGPGVRNKDKKSPDKNKLRQEGPCFSSVRSPRKTFFSIHPEWVSENLNVQRLSLQERTGTYPPRRCRSAPPGAARSRNPITGDGSQARARSCARTKQRLVDSYDKQEYRKDYKSQSTAFSSVGSPRKQDFTIHPDWVSESRQTSAAAALACRNLSLSYHERTLTYPPRRTRSAPSPLRNIITWMDNDN